MQSIVIDHGFYESNWGLARVIRRRPPWEANKQKYPINTFFSCERDGTGVDVYHIDTGVLTTHNEFSGRATTIYEHVSPGIPDADGHGTVTASLCCGETLGTARGSTLFATKSHGGSSIGQFNSPSAINACIEAILEHYEGRASLNRPAVCCMAIALSSEISRVSDLIDAGIVVVCSAGNQGEQIDSGSPRYPAMTSDVICVGAISASDLPAYFSRDDGTISATNWGSYVTVMVPGQYSKAASNAGDDEYIRTSSSTSGAAGFAAGVVACMLQGHSKLTGRSQVQAVKAALLANATDGRLVIPASSHVPAGGLPDAILYLDPSQTAPEPIPGLS